MLNLIGVIIAFILVIFLIRKKFNFGLSLILGSFIISIFSLSKVPLIDIFKGFSKALIYDFDENAFDFQTIELAILLTLIYILAKTMQQTGAINKMIKSLRTIFYKGGTLGVIPAVYGLMPVPGGALFSAPLIDEEGKKFNLKQNQKNFLNVWWRHIWFPIYPVSSAMLLIIGSKFSNIGIYELIIANFPAFIAFIIIGIIYIRLYIKKISNFKEKPKKDYNGLVFLIPPIIPIIVYIVIFILFYLVGFEDANRFQRVIFVIGVLVSFLVLYILLKIELRQYLEILKKSISLNLALAIVGIMIFREIFEVSKANQIITESVSMLSFPPILILILIPLILGFLTGYNFGAIALSYFLVQPFFELINVNIVGLTSIIFISSLVGYLISPIHLCNVVSSDYLKTDTTRMYKMYLPAITSLMLIQTIFILIFYGS
jgi:hypothetical protein